MVTGLLSHVVIIRNHTLDMASSPTPLSLWTWLCIIPWLQGYKQTYKSRGLNYACVVGLALLHNKRNMPQVIHSSKEDEKLAE